MSRKSMQLDEQVYNYLLSVSLREHQILKECREQTAKHSMARMQIAPEQGQFISLIFYIKKFCTSSIACVIGIGGKALIIRLP